MSSLNLCGDAVVIKTIMNASKFIFAIFLIIYTMNHVSACSCIGQSTVEVSVKGAEAVLVGKIVSKQVLTFTDSSILDYFPNDTILIKTSLYQYKIAQYRFLVHDSYKGKIKTDTVDIYTGMGGGDCGVHFEIGDRYIVYGYSLRRNWKQLAGQNGYWTDICTRTCNYSRKEINQIEKYSSRKTINKDDEHSLIFDDPADLPEFKNGGVRGLMKFIEDSLQYPQTIGCWQGSVVVEFTVDTLGNVNEVKVVKGLAPEYNEEAMRVVKMLTFFPGSVNGRLIETKMVIPIKFKIE